MSQSLFEISTELRSLAQQLEDELIASGGDVSEGSVAADIESAIKDYQWRQAEKVDAYVSIIRNIQAQEGMVANAIALLEKRRQVLVNQVERMKNAAKFALEAQGLDKVKGIIHGGLRIQKNGTTPLDILEADPEKWPEEFIVIRKQIDNKKVREALDSDVPTEILDGFARLGVRGTHIRVI